MWSHVPPGGELLLYNSGATGSRNLWLAPLEGADSARQITTRGGNALTHASLSPDGERVAYISTHTGRAEVWVANIDGSNPIQLTDTDEAEVWPAWSPDGTWIAFGRMQAPRNALVKVRPNGGATVTVVENGCFRPDWSPIDDRIACYSQNPRRVDVIDANTGAVSLTVPLTGWRWALPVWSPDASVMSVVGPTGDRIWLIDSGTGDRTLAVQLPSDFHVWFRVNWDRDGSLILNRADVLSDIALLDGLSLPGGETR